MNLGGHIGAGWLLAHAAALDRFERRYVLALALLPDIDGLFLLWRGSLDHWHRTFGHNVWLWLAAPLVALAFVRRGRRLAMLGLFYAAIASHVVLDLVGTGWWGLYPLWPVGDFEILMSDWIAEDTMKYGIQPALLVFFLAAMVWLYVRHRRTPLEALSPAVDALLVNFVLLPWRHRCGECGRLAFYRCTHCGRPLCPHHRAVNRRFEVACRPLCPEVG